jgi:Hemerythrin HHE cation binding domain
VKRAEALRPLSREHLAALLTAKKLREATGLDEAAGAFLDFWHGDGIRHFRIEEDVLLPAWAVHAEVDRDGVARMLGDHLAIRREALRLEAGDATLEEARALGQFLHDHVRFEERELFPKVEEALDPAALSSLAAAIEEAEGSTSS